MKAKQLIEELKQMPQDLEVNASMLTPHDQYEVVNLVYRVEHFVNTGYNRMDDCVIIRS